MRKPAGGRDGWLSRRELEVRLGKSKRTIARWIDMRIIPPGRRCPDGDYWRPEEVDRWLLCYDKSPKDIERALRERVA